MNWKLMNRVWHANIGMLAILTLGIIALSCPFIAHKWDFTFGKALMKIHYGEFISPQWRWLWIDSQGLFLGFLVLSGMMMHRKTVKQAANMAADDPTVAGSSVTVLGAGATAAALATEGEKLGLRIFRCEEMNYGKLRLELERWLVIPQGAGKALLGCVQPLKPGQLKRLQCFIESSAESEALVEALVQKGATVLEVDSTVTTWQAAVLKQLENQAEKRKSAPTAKPKPAAAAGFTLLEMLVSIAIFAMLVGGAASALKTWLSSKKCGKQLMTL
jgi:prepilin-type N-terminal cleavage/methylation domain-containing protein